MDRLPTIAILAIAVVVTLPAGVAGQVGTQQADLSTSPQAAVDCQFPVTATDATGTAVTVDEEPQRVVVLGPSAARTMWTIDAQDQVVGMPVNQYTADLPGAEDRTNVVGEDGRPVQEKVLGLQPDLVLAPNIIRPQTVENLRDAGLTVYHFNDSTSMEDVAAKTERTGRLVGEFDAAASVAAETRGQIAAVENAVAEEERPRAYYVLGGSYSTGNGTFIHGLITTAGARNIVAEAGITGYKPVNAEVIVERDPEVLIVPKGIPLPSNDAINGTTAVEEGNIVRVNANFINQPSPATRTVLRNLTRELHPDAYDSIDFEAIETPEQAVCQADVTTETATATETATDDGSTVTPTTTQGSDSPTATPTATPGASGPGFTAVLALVAMGVLALLGRQ